MNQLSRVKVESVLEKEFNLYTFIKVIDDSVFAQVEEAARLFLKAKNAEGLRLNLSAKLHRSDYCLNGHPEVTIHLNRKSLGFAASKNNSVNELITEFGQALNWPRNVNVNQLYTGYRSLSELGLVQYSEIYACLSIVNSNTCSITFRDYSTSTHGDDDTKVAKLKTIEQCINDMFEMLLSVS